MSQNGNQAIVAELKAFEGQQSLLVSALRVAFVVALQRPAIHGKSTKLPPQGDLLATPFPVLPGQIFPVEVLKQ